MDWPAIAHAAARANAAYLKGDDQSKAAFAALGDAWVGQFQDDSHQAVLSVDAAGATHLSISGTRGPLSEDLICDLSLDPVPVAGGNVTRGVYEGMQNVWDWALSTAPAGSAISVCGHSLGGARTHLTPLFLPVPQIGALHSFEAPKFADAAFYAAYAEALKDMECVLNGADLWAAFPWIDDRWARPLPAHVWLHDAGFSIIPADQWPGGWDPADHDMSEVQARCEKIAAASDLKPAA